MVKEIKELVKIKPFDFGPGTEKTSKEIDKILYSLNDNSTFDNDFKTIKDIHIII